MSCDHVYACPDCDQRFHDLATERDRLRAALEDALLFEPPAGAEEAWERAWAAVRGTTSPSRGEP